MKDYYNLTEMLILKIDIFEKGIKFPKIEYEIYDPVKKIQLDLNIFKDIKIDILIPVIINENELFKYNPSSEYYNDKCFPYKTEKGTDIIVKDRRNEFIDNNLTLCENNCEYKGYDIKTKKALCNCEIKDTINLLSELYIDKDKLIKINY